MDVRRGEVSVAKMELLRNDGQIVWNGKAGFRGFLAKGHRVQVVACHKGRWPFVFGKREQAADFFKPFGIAVFHFDQMHVLRLDASLLKKEKHTVFARCRKQMLERGADKREAAMAKPIQIACSAAAGFDVVVVDADGLRTAALRRADQHVVVAFFGQLVDDGIIGGGKTEE